MGLHIGASRLFGIFGELVVRRGIEFLSHRISPLTPTCRQGGSSPFFCAAPPVCGPAVDARGTGCDPQHMPDICRDVAPGRDPYRIGLVFSMLTRLQKTCTFTCGCL